MFAALDTVVAPNPAERLFVFLSQVEAGTAATSPMTGFFSFNRLATAGGDNTGVAQFIDCENSRPQTAVALPPWRPTANRRLDGTMINAPPPDLMWIKRMQF
jgi:hypothetical protein